MQSVQRWGGRVDLTEKVRPDGGEGVSSEVVWPEGVQAQGAAR